MKLTFLGAAGTVTGSRHLLELGNERILVDCGLFQGLKALRLRNWQPFPVAPRSLSAVVLTHAHLDHSGYLPALVRDGFHGHVYCTSATADYCGILLPDSAHLQEQDAEYANRHGFSKHRPARPLYTAEDAEAALGRLAPVSFGTSVDLPGGARIRFNRAGHILGAAIVECWWGSRKLVFSGDLGRYGDPMLPDPSPIGEADVLVTESTYGNRKHDPRDAEASLGEIVERTVARGGTVVIPAFAVGRAQLLLYHLERLKTAGRLANVPIFVNSPMAIDASEILCRNVVDQKLTEDECRKACGVATYVRTVEDSKALNASAMPKVIVSASGMATGGRVLHHLKRFAPDPRSTIVFAGYQAAGTRGAAMLAGARQIKIHGAYVPVRAEIAELPMLSAHADGAELMRWLGGFQRPPSATYVVHGEPDGAQTLRARIEKELGWHCVVPGHEQEETLG
jgi:metallo-beta-lactamase family protein